MCKKLTVHFSLKIFFKKYQIIKIMNKSCEKKYIKNCANNLNLYQCNFRDKKIMKKKS